MGALATDHVAQLEPGPEVGLLVGPEKTGQDLQDDKTHHREPHDGVLLLLLQPTSGTRVMMRVAARLQLGSSASSCLN